MRGYLDVEVHDVLLVHMLQSVADLSYVADHLGLGHLVVLVGDLIKQLAPGQTGKHTHTNTHAPRVLAVDRRRAVSEFSKRNSAA